MSVVFPEPTSCAAPASLVVGTYAMLAMAYKSFAMQPDASMLASATTGIPIPEE